MISPSVTMIDLVRGVLPLKRIPFEDDTSWRIRVERADQGELHARFASHGGHDKHDHLRRCTRPHRPSRFEFCTRARTEERLKGAKKGGVEEGRRRGGRRGGSECQLAS